MPRRSGSEPPPPTCPLCGTSRVAVVGREGINNQLTVLHCEVCDRKWSEVVVADSDEVEETL
jgi:formate dehydrogenase maturation protein FdhE